MKYLEILDNIISENNKTEKIQYILTSDREWKDNKLIKFSLVLQNQSREDSNVYKHSLESVILNPEDELISEAFMIPEERAAKRLLYTLVSHALWERLERTTKQE